ncbi:hypothetical protein BX666DRAFT_1906534 [Dichotomocladium elegans]|nr:hypothetical protein BX666DRAFT_1906534 [Dichotomocladium elegans]
MVHWRCRHLHSFATQHVNYHMLQQWRLLLLQIAEPHRSARFPVPSFILRSQQQQQQQQGQRRAFSMCSCRGNKRSASTQQQQYQHHHNHNHHNHQLSRTLTFASAASPSPPYHSDPEMKRATKRKIPAHIANKIDKVILSPEAMASAMTILSHLEAGQNELAWDAFECMARNTSFSRTIVQRLLGCLRADIRQGAKSPVQSRRLMLLLHHVKSNRVYLDENEFRVVLELLDRLDLVERAEATFKTMASYCNQPATIRTYNKLAAAYLRRIKALDGQQRHSRYMDKLHTLVRSLEEKGIAPDVLTFNILLTARGQLRQVKEAEAIFDWMERAGVAPNNRTVNIALDLYGKLGVECGLMHAISPAFRDSSGAEGDDVVTFATRIRNAVYRRDMESAERTLKAMVERGIYPNEYVYAHLVLGYVQNGDISKARTVIKLINKSPDDLKPTAYLYGPIIQFYARAHDYKKAYSVLSEMLDQGIPANLTIYTILASMFTDSPIFEEPTQAIHILRSFYRHASSNEPLDQAALTVLIQSHGVAGARDLDFDLSWTPLECKDDVHHHQHSTIIHEEDNSTCHNSAHEDGDTTPLGLSRRELHARAAQESYNAISHPDDLAYTAMLAAYARLKMPEEAWRFWTSMKTNLKLDLHTFHYNALIMGLVYDEAWYKTAREVFDEMVTAATTPSPESDRLSNTNKPVPDIATFDMMIEGAYSSGDLDSIRHYWRMSLRPKPNETADPPSLLARSYYFALQTMIATNDPKGVDEVYDEFKSLPSLPASATLWAHKIHDIYRNWNVQYEGIQSRLPMNCILWVRRESWS